MFFRARHKTRQSDRDPGETNQILNSINTKLNDIDIRLFTINNHLNNLDAVKHELEANFQSLSMINEAQKQEDN
ncbi:hypothetical protein B0T21DRAFT_408341 [Apiosordaria backusii]|uniref:Uncharacterized protein n=1 Tax=Apiosordaria backusii TaxID=314023 RepID=A0AA40ETT1_9PEZI|nr:hypothetical protein B0T21DRAFT_408341 [Apiosordaria backusii]